MHPLEQTIADLTTATKGLLESTRMLFEVVQTQQDNIERLEKRIDQLSGQVQAVDARTLPMQMLG